MAVGYDTTHVIKNFSNEYQLYCPESFQLNQRAVHSLVDGGSHSLRLIQPFPPRICSSNGAHIVDEDGHTILDFWQGHFANLLGHNPEIIIETLANGFSHGFGLQSGFTDRLQIETAEILCRQTGAEKVRFTTSGALATMYSIMLARAFTGKSLVMKLGGGWHGAQPWSLKGVHYGAGGAAGYQQPESEGLPDWLMNEVIVTGVNDLELLESHFKEYGNRLACFILEPFMGAAGFLPASAAYLQLARKLADQYGVVLIFDEVVAGFRFRAGDTGRMLGGNPDLSIFGKIIGGGMPVAAVAGRGDILGLVGREQGARVKFSGGTYSAHPASMLAAKTMISYLTDNEKVIYPRLAALGAAARAKLENAFAEEGILMRCTGNGDGLPDSSMFMLHFPRNDDFRLDRPEILNDPTQFDMTLRTKVISLGLLLQNVHLVEGHGAFSFSHPDDSVDILVEACRQVARRIRRGE